MQKIYDADYFIKKFESIPEEKWNDFVQYDEETKTRCAFGHCGWKIPKGDVVNGDQTFEGRKLTELFNSVGFEVGSKNWITDVNNGFSPDYKQETPRQRMLAVLNDIKKLTRP